MKIPFTKMHGLGNDYIYVDITDRELQKIRAFIKENYKEMYIKWSTLSNSGFYGD